MLKRKRSSSATAQHQRARAGARVRLRVVSVTDAEACRFVSDHFDRRAGGVRPLGAGEGSRAYAFILDGREAVIRFGDHVEDFRKDQVMAAYTCRALPIPAVVEIGTAGDGYFAVSEFAPGVRL